MSKRPETRFAGPANGRIGYQLLGEGPVNLVYFAGAASNVDMRWEHPASVSFIERMAAFSRLLVFDRRGSGLSDPVELDHLPSWEEWSGDLGVVLDDVGWERAALFAAHDAGPLAMMFAATAPERVSALVLLNTAARLQWAEDNPAGRPRDELRAMLMKVAELWGTTALSDLMVPSRQGDEEFRQWYARYLRASQRPREVAAAMEALVDMDLRSALTAIQAPTLVISCAGYAFVPTALGRDLAARIPGARFLELNMGDAGFLAGGRVIEEAIGLVEEFITGARAASATDRMLATVLFTDLVGSTQRAAELGDQAWRSLLEEQRWVVRQEVAKHRGREIETTGDGFLLLFDGPGRAARCAQAIVQRVRGLGLDARAGLHTGECEVVENGVAGLAVHLAARVTGRCQPGEVLATGTVRDLVVGSSLRFESRGRHALRGVPGEWELFSVSD